MITAEENRETMLSMKRSLVRAHDEISVVADFMEGRLTTEYDRAESKVYGSACRTLGTDSRNQ